MNLSNRLETMQTWFAPNSSVILTVVNFNLLLLPTTLCYHEAKQMWYNVCCCFLSTKYSTFFANITRFNFFSFFYYYFLFQYVFSQNVPGTFFSTRYSYQNVQLLTGSECRLTLVNKIKPHIVFSGLSFSYIQRKIVYYGEHWHIPRLLLSVLNKQRFNKNTYF